MSDDKDLTSQDESLENLLADYVTGEDAGQRQDRQAIVARYPRHAAELLEFFANRDRLQRLAAPFRAVDAASSNHSNDRSLGEFRYFGDYELLEELAAGGMGVVYKARQISLNRIVAVKMILKGTLASESDVKRFRAEAKAAASLQHPAIVAIHEVGLHEGQHYFSMDFVDGTSLAQIPGGQPLSARQAAEYIRSAAEAVHYAHQQGTLHRDIKPSNIMVDRVGRLRITDFGLAKRIDENSDLTIDGMILGTPSYMPPEQASGKRSLVGAASDIYSLGAVLYELLTSRPPFRGESLTETLRQVETLDPVSARLFNPSIPRDIETICLKCLAKEPHKRYGSAQLLADDLGRFLRGEPIHARPVSRSMRVWRWCRRNPTVAGLTTAVTSLLVTVAAVSTVASIHLKRERDTVQEQKLAIEVQAGETQSESNRAQAAERVANLRLYESLVSHARAGRFSRRAGQRTEVLKAIEEATGLAQRLNLGPESTQTLRDEYIACLAVVDLHVEREWTGPVITDRGTAFDRTLTRYVFRESNGKQSIRRVEDGVELVALSDAPGGAQRQQFSPDGSLLASRYSGNKFVVWDASTGHRQESMEGVKDFSFSGDGQTLALSFGARIETRRVDSWERISNLEVTEVSWIALHPDGKRIAVTIGNAVEIWNFESGRQEFRFVLPARPSDRLAWRTDGEFLAAACADRVIYVWDIARRRQHVALRGHDNVGISVQFSHDGSILASSSWDGTTRLWDPLLGRELVRADGLVLQISSDGQRLAYDDGIRRVGIWHLSGNEGRRTLAAFLARQGTRGTSGMAINHSGNLMAASGGDGVIAWKLPEGQMLGRFDWGNAGSVQFDYLDRLVVPVGKSLRLASLVPNGDALNVRETTKPGEFKGNLRNALVSHDGRTALANEGPNTIAVISVAEPDRPVVRLHHEGASHTSTGIALSPNGRQAGTMAWIGIGLKLWDTSNGLLIEDLWPQAAGGSLAFSPDGHWLAAATSEELRIWKTSGWQLKSCIPRFGQGSSNGPVAFSHDGHILAMAMTRRAVQLIDPIDGRRLATIEPTNGSYEVRSLAFTPDARILAICYSDSVDLWDLEFVRKRLSSIGLDWVQAATDEPAPNRQQLMRLNADSD